MLRPLAAMKTTAGNEINTVNVGLGSKQDDHTLPNQTVIFPISKVQSDDWTHTKPQRISFQPHFANI